MVYVQNVEILSRIRNINVVIVAGVEFRFLYLQVGLGFVIQRIIVQNALQVRAAIISENGW
jgi:ribosome biogenesis protein Nip4